MFLNSENHKYQVIVTVFLGFLFYSQTKNEVNSAVFIILTNLILLEEQMDRI